MTMLWLDQLGCQSVGTMKMAWIQIELQFEP